MASHPPPNGWTLIREAIEKRPQIIALFALDMGLILLADVFGFVLVLVAVAYSTWIVMPWAFYEKLKARKADTQLKWLRHAEVLLFVSGTFLVFYAIMDLVGEGLTLDIFLSALLPLMKAVLLVFGVVLLLGGLYGSFRVVNFYSSAEEPEHSLAYWGILPFAVFDVVVIVVMISGIAQGYIATGKMSVMGWAFFISFFLALIGTALSIKWVKYVVDLGKRLSLRGLIVVALVIQPIAINACLYCQSPRIVKNGLRHNKYGDIQVFQCSSCGRDFTINFGFERMKHNPHAVTTAMQLYFSGESLRNTSRSLRMMGVEVSYQTVWNWIEKYTGLMEKYLDKITPKVSDTWRADESYVKIKGNMKYVFAMMDDETRFWIAQEVANTKDAHDARHLFQMAKERAGKRPQILITDGLRSYRDAWLKEFRTSRQVDSTVHIREITFKGKHNNNKMERMNGEIRDREKVTRNLKREDTPILVGMQIFHNYVRPHMGLKGKTPADLAGIQVDGEDKWLTLIQNAKCAQQTRQRNCRKS